MIIHVLGRGLWSKTVQFRSTHKKKHRYIATKKVPKQKTRPVYRQRKWVICDYLLLNLYYRKKGEILKNKLFEEYNFFCVLFDDASRFCYRRI